MRREGRDDKELLAHGALNSRRTRHSPPQLRGRCKRERCLTKAASTASNPTSRAVIAAIQVAPRKAQRQNRHAAPNFLMSLAGFHEAQANPTVGSATALAEIRRGRKTSHWIWYIF